MSFVRVTTMLLHHHFVGIISMVRQWRQTAASERSNNKTINGIQLSMNSFSYKLNVFLLWFQRSAKTSREGLVAHLVSLCKFHHFIVCFIYFWWGRCPTRRTPETSVCPSAFFSFLVFFFLCVSLFLFLFFLLFFFKYNHRCYRAVVCFSSTWLTKRFGFGAAAGVLSEQKQ